MFLLPRTGEAPEVRLVRFTGQVERSDDLKVPNNLPFPGFPESDQEAWSCGLEISVHRSGSIVMSHEVKVEMADPGGSWTAVALPKRPELPPWLLRGMRVCTRKVEFTVPSETRRVRLTICCRPLTLQERVRQVLLAKDGLWRRFPKVSRWTSDRLPNTERWTEYRWEVELPRVSIGVVASDQSPPVTDETAKQRLEGTPDERSGFNR
jgi:hypothetical protein